MLTITNTTVTRDELWRAFRRTHEVRLRERYCCMLLLMDGKTYPKIAQCLPELHPQERIWKWLRRVVTHNHWFETLSAPIEAVRDFFRYLADVKDQVQWLYGLKTLEPFVA
jgi:hypothetical protein